MRTLLSILLLTTAAGAIADPAAQYEYLTSQAQSPSHQASDYTRGNSSYANQSPSKYYEGTVATGGVLVAEDPTQPRDTVQATSNERDRAFQTLSNIMKSEH